MRQIMPPEKGINMRDEIKKAISELSEHSSLRKFVDDELAFYKTYFDDFTRKVVREKKILEFENPNRMKVTYEFDVKELGKTTSPLFVFLPDTRKNWMKVMWENKRLSISSSESISESIFAKVEDDLKKLCSNHGFKDSVNDLWKKEIWPNHIPCFVDGTFIKEASESGQLVVEFYDSFEKFDPVGKRNFLFDERRYEYDYHLESGSSHWIYVKAPEKFQVEVKTADAGVKEIPGNDPEIKAYRITSDKKKDKVRFTIDIKVPVTLKWWYGIIVSLSVIYLLAFLLLAIGFVVQKKALSPAFAQVGISLVAAIIATRGWIMNDETVLKRVSITMTILAILILVLLVIMYSVAGFVHVG